jgi:methylenetetrahydrofolate reductase (NADPH)
MSFKETFNRKDFVFTAELPLTPDSTEDSLVADAKLLGDSVDGYLLTDNQYGQPHMSPVGAAGILINNGLDPIVQLSCRNRNRIALMGELLAARAIGIDSLMLVQGGFLPEDYKPRPKAVTDMSVNELVATASLINEDEKLGTSRNFLIGTSATVHETVPNWRPKVLLTKADSGAHLIITQVCLDIELLRHYVAALVSQRMVRRMSVIASIAVAFSAELAEWIRDNRYKAIVPDATIERLRRSAEQADEGIGFYAEIVREIAAIPGISGINFAAAGYLENIPEVIAASGINH